MSEYRRLLEQAADTHGLLPELLELYGANETLRAENERVYEAGIHRAAEGRPVE